MKSIFFWDMTPCSALSGTRRFGGTYRLHLQGCRIGYMPSDVLGFACSNLEKNHKKLESGIYFPGKDSNSGPLEYEGVLTIIR
jgi:hypothetical protein